MANLRGYLSKAFTGSFLTIFLPFFFIISLVYLVKIASLTAKIAMSFQELLTLYSYSIPDILFYTLPLSFVATVAILLVRLSMENELIALYALGVPAHKIVRYFLLLGVLFSTFLLALSLLAMPLTKQYYKAFKNAKIDDARLSIQAGELGQKFGSYYIYMREKKGDTFYDLVIYNHTKGMQEQFFSSKEGKINHYQGVTSLLLKDGYGYTYTKEKLQQLQYQTLEIFNTLEREVFHFQSTLHYWLQAQQNHRVLRKLIFYIFISFIPLLSVYLVASFTMINPRYQKNYAFVSIFATTLFFYLLASSLGKWGSFSLLFTLSALIFILGRLLFHWRVSKYF